MAKVITVRLSEDAYDRIASVARDEHRPISNLITTIVLNELEAGDYVDAVEMAQIRSDARLMTKLRTGHRQAFKRQGRLVG